MLVLSRKAGQEIVIGEDIRVVVLEVRSDRVRLGIAAPAEVPVHRKEVYDRLKRSELPATGLNREASGNHASMSQ